MNFPVPLFALLAARQANDSASDAGRVALMSMAIKPPMLGLLMAIVMARQATPAAAAAKGAAGGGMGAQGAAILDQVSDDADFHSFFPSFIEYTREQAQRFADELLLKADFDVDTGEFGHARLVVVRQEPGVGGPWPQNRRVKFHLGMPPKM